ncbi:MAG TPA: hypothetical protein VLH19_03545 [Patescibacteria group bacterium]|nr:hypothetical protein [Patescibacteria group bacterium]
MKDREKNSAQRIEEEREAIYHARGIEDREKQALDRAKKDEERRLLFEAQQNPENIETLNGLLRQMNDQRLTEVLREVQKRIGNKLEVKIIQKPEIYDGGVSHGRLRICFSGKQYAFNKSDEIGFHPEDKSVSLRFEGGALYFASLNALMELIEKALAHWDLNHSPRNIISRKFGTSGFYGSLEEVISRYLNSSSKRE